MPQEWFIKSRSGSLGPVSLRALKRLARKGKLKGNTGVSPDGVKWIKAKRVAGLTFGPPTDHDAGPVRTPRDRRPTEWFVQTKSSVVGPFSIERLNRIAAKGRLLPNVAVSADRVRWIKAKLVPGIEFPFVNVAAPKQSKRPNEHSRVGPLISALPVINELPLSGPIPTLTDLAKVTQTGVVFALPVVDEFPISDKSPTVAHLPIRRSDHAPVSLPVINELPIIGPLPTITDLPPRILAKVGMEVPVINELPIVEAIPKLSEMPVRGATTNAMQSKTPAQSDASPQVSLPVIQELPISGDIPSLLTDTLASQPDRPTIPTQRETTWNTIRKAEYVKRFGPMSYIHSNVDDDVTVCVHPANDERPFTTLVTNGMSDRVMRVPGVNGDGTMRGPLSPRAELIWYVDHPHAGYIDVLKSLAHVPQNYGRGFWYGATMNNGEPASSIFTNSVLNSFLFMVSSIVSDHAIRDTVSIGNCPLQLLWVVPITLAERIFVENAGMQHFCWLLDQHHHSILLDPSRACFVGGPTNIAV